MAQAVLQLAQPERCLAGGRFANLRVADERPAAGASLDKAVFCKLFVRALHGHERDPQGLGDTLGAGQLVPRRVDARGDLVAEPTGDFFGAWRLFWLPVHT